MVRRLQLLVLALAVTACGGGAGAPAPERSLAYGVPGVAPTYTTNDSMRFRIQAGGMGTMEIAVDYAATAQLAFEAAAGDYDVTVTLVAFDGRFSNPMAGSVTADASGVEGPIVVNVSPRGETEMVDVPTTSTAFEQIAGAENLVRDFFVRLPDRPVEAGDTWTDTIRTRTDNGQTLTISQSILTATVAGDTAVAGRTLLLIRTSYDNTMNLSGTSGGTEISQRLSGTTTGFFLWDPERGFLVERHEVGSLAGTLDLPGMGIGGMPVEATVKRNVRLQ